MIFDLILSIQDVPRYWDPLWTIFVNGSLLFGRLVSSRSSSLKVVYEGVNPRNKLEEKRFSKEYFISTNISSYPSIHHSPFISNIAFTSLIISALFRINFQHLLLVLKKVEKYKMLIGEKCVIFHAKSSHDEYIKLDQQLWCWIHKKSSKFYRYFYQIILLANALNEILNLLSIWSTLRLSSLFIKKISRIGHHHIWLIVVGTLIIWG